MRTASEAVGFMSSPIVFGRNSGDERLIQKSLNSAVKSSGAVSPAARATASMTPVRYAGEAVGSTTVEHHLRRRRPHADCRFAHPRRAPA